MSETHIVQPAEYMERIAEKYSEPADMDKKHKFVIKAIKQDIPTSGPLGVPAFTSPPSYRRKLNLGFIHPISFASGRRMVLNNLRFVAARSRRARLESAQTCSQANASAARLS